MQSGTRVLSSESATRGRSGAPSSAPGVAFALVTAAGRPARFRLVRWLGDKRSMVVHDLDATVDACGLDDLLASERFASFGPDSVAEARNRGYRPCPRCAGAGHPERARTGRN